MPANRESMDPPMDPPDTMTKIAMDFIPILLFYWFLVDSKNAIEWSVSTLGKLVSICVIAFYASVKPVYGIFVCLVILVYYQSDWVEETLNMERSDQIEYQLAKMNAEWRNRTYPNVVLHPFPGQTPVYADVSGQTTFLEYGNSRELLPTPDLKMWEGFQSNDPTLYSYTPVKPYRRVAEEIMENREKKAELMAIFRKEHCANGKLLHRGMDVAPEMSDHIFREIHFHDETNKCNVCHPDCQFSIIEEKIATERELQTPKTAVVPEEWRKMAIEAWEKMFS